MAADQGTSPQSIAGAQVGQAQRGSHRSRAFRTPHYLLTRYTPQLSSSKPSWQAGCRLQRRSPSRHSPLLQLSWLGEQGALEAPSPDRAVVGTVKGSVLAAHEVAWGSA